MENFFLEEKFCPDLSDLCDELDIDEDNVSQLPDDWSLEVCETSMEPIVTLSVDWIMDKIDQERWTENGNEIEKVEKLLAGIDFKTINEKMPKLYYPTRKTFRITKADLLDYLK